MSDRDRDTITDGARARSAAQAEFESYVDDFVTYLAHVRRLSPNTVRAYQTDLEAYVAWTHREGVAPLEVSHRQMRRYLAELTRAGYSPKTINRHLSAIRMLYRWLIHEGITDKDCAAAIASPKLAKSLPRTMTDGDARAILATCEGDDAESVRDRAVIELMYATGARISEVSALNVRDVDLRQRQVRLFGKGSKERIVPIYSEAARAIESYLATARPELAALRKRGRPTGALFLSTRGSRMSADALRTRFEGHAAEAGLGTDITPHAMRHTFATELLSGGADLRSVQELLGHESLATTQIYTHLSVDRLKDATRQAHPRSSG